MKKLSSGLLILTFAAALIITSRAEAVTYQVDRSFSNATLTGTVDVPIGNYVIENQAPHPFTNVNLKLTVDATSYNLTFANTAFITGTGQFIIDAAPTTLTFTASGNGSNPADLDFSDSIIPGTFNFYGIGSNGSPAFETAITNAGVVTNTNLSFPVVFGTAVPEPSVLTLLLPLALLLRCRCRV